MSTELHPDFPVVSGEYGLTKGWRVTLPEPFNRRIEEGSLVLWRPALTFWCNVWNSQGDVTVDGVLARLLADASAARRNEQIGRAGDLVRLSYELDEDDGERDASGTESINGFVIVPSGYVQVSAYADTAEARALAYAIVGSIREEKS